MVPGFSDLMVPVKWFNETSTEFYKLFRAVCSGATKRKLHSNWSCVIFRDWSKNKCGCFIRQHTQNNQVKNPDRQILKKYKLAKKKDDKSSFKCKTKQNL